MPSYGLTIPGADSRLYVTTISTARPAPDPKPSSLPVFSSRATRFGSIKAKAATVNDAAAAEEERKELSFYELLGIPESGSITEIKQAYKQLARKYHPDVSPPGRVEEYTEKFIRVQEAYETLSDSRRRAMYDQDMARGLHLAFSARRYQYDEGMEGKGDWKNRWQSQLSELKRRSSYKDDRQNMSWGARMRRQREGLSDEV
ncbi:putative DnaJ domain-containing protein [Rosa chinensis]|uniref:Putative DnaJ domain-containing protein n=1 Tax=Rosa chinensis TaxID=74649 RepID=A0A2P6QW48_ROSCH|nr:chaperone protein dnaJ 20, chloroplastic [Rosa chinensis]PRQ38423.1 putative DnaJ domain-containing protein [Rosa chinensis]